MLTGGINQQRLFKINFRQNLHPESALNVDVKDVDTVYQRALAVGATSVMEPADQFYGDQGASVTDKFGNNWWIATHVEDVSAEETMRRMKEQYG